MIPRIAYRLRQFSLAWIAKPDPARMEQARQVLGPSLWPLFLQLQPSERAHSLDVLQNLLQQGQHDPDLLVAALLHDAGKSRSPLSVWDRAWIVLARKIAPRFVKTWGMGAPSGWRRIFVVAAQHPAWGADLAAAAGASPRTVDLIRQHQDALDPASPLTVSLRILQGADDES